MIAIEFHKERVEHFIDCVPSEHREMIEEQFKADLHRAIEFYSMLTFKVMDLEFDAQFEPSVIALIDGSTTKFKPVRGFREFPDADPTR
jgi:hypothetical protein